MGKSPSTSNVKQNLTALWECLVGLQIFPNFLLSAWEWLDTEFFFICGWTSPIMLLLSLCIAEKVVRVTVFQYSFCVPNNAFLPPVCVLHLLPAQKREKKKRYRAAACVVSSVSWLCLFPHQHHHPLPHDYVGSGCAVVHRGSGHALLPIHLWVRLFVLPYYAITHLSASAGLVMRQTKKTNLFEWDAQMMWGCHFTTLGQEH